MDVDLHLRLLHLLVTIDHQFARVALELRWAPATPVFVFVSSWALKGPLFIAAGLVADLWRRRPPVAGLAALVGVLGASLASTVLKDAFDRPRPPRAGIGTDAVGSVPDSWSFPSGHSLTAFAGATTIALLVPRWRVPALLVAALIGLSRIYLGVHFVSDVLIGAVLGMLVGAAAALAVCAARRAAGHAVARPA